MGIRSDLRKRLESAHENGLCLVPASTSDAHRLRQAYRRGDLVSPAPQVYALPELWEGINPVERERHRVCALAKLHPTWVFAGVSAAAMHGLSVSYGLLGRVHLACGRNARARNTRHYIRHVIDKDDCVLIDGVRVCSLERTVFDCTRSYGFDHALAIADSALRVSEKTRDWFVEAFGRYSRNHRNAWRPAEIMALADSRAESGGESLARAQMIQNGYMLPELQKKLHNPLNDSESFRVDFFWKLGSGNVAGEMDGREKYVNPAMTGGRSAVDILADERVRESLVTSYNVRVMRFSYKDVRNARTFCRIMDLFGIPRGFAVPRVALS